jgi:hypothetical protein
MVYKPTRSCSSVVTITMRARTCELDVPELIVPCLSSGKMHIWWQRSITIINLSTNRNAAVYIILVALQTYEQFYREFIIELFFPLTGKAKLNHSTQCWVVGLPNREHVAFVF